jgi:2-polyprenyl-3-methyl-5-hydroxy-6-metoxy-1,4-benzoquinol methylase
MSTPAMARSDIPESSDAETSVDATLSNERIRALLQEVRGPDILHVGCVNHKVPESSAERAQSLHHQLCRSFAAANVLGLDIDATGVERMKQMGFRVELGDAHNLKFNACFDTVLAGELIEHLQNPGEFLEGAARALKPGGWLVLSTPNVFSVMLNLMYWKNYDRAFNPEHALWLCPQTLRELLRRYGFCIHKLDFVDDLEPALVSSWFYRVFAHGWMGARVLLPRRFRNTMVVACNLA